MIKINDICKRLSNNEKYKVLEIGENGYALCLGYDGYKCTIPLADLEYIRHDGVEKTTNSAIYAGSFDPFTNGHLDIVRKASKVFEEVHIVIANNNKKKRQFDCIDQMIIAIENTLKEENITNCIVAKYDGLVAKYCQENEIKSIIRGLRNSMDFEYEENIAKINELIDPELETIYFRTNNAAISSSMVKEFLSFDLDVSEFVPINVLKLIKASKIL